MRSRICGGFSVQFGSSGSLLIPSRRVWRSYKDFGVERFCLRSNYYNYGLALLAALYAAEPLFRLVIGISVTNPNEHAGFAPFELVSLIIEAFTWCLILVMLVVKTKVYIRELRWYVRFGVIYAIVANIMMLSLTLPLKEYYTRSVMLLYYVEFVGQVIFGVLLLMYVPSLDPYPGYTPIQTDFVDDAEYGELPGGEQVCPERHIVLNHSQIDPTDTRALEGPIVADKNCEKIHFMAPNIYCCGAGTAADTEAVTDMVRSQLKLHRYHTGRESRVVTTLSLLKSHLFNYQGHISADLVLGGVDVPMKGGFNFDLCKRNKMLANKGLKPSSFLKTGTTIVGLVYPDGVILEADTRALEGPIVADKNFEAIVEKNQPGAIFILEKASLEVAKVGKNYQLLNSDDHANFLKRNKRNPAEYRPWHCVTAMALSS